MRLQKSLWPSVSLFLLLMCLLAALLGKQVVVHPASPPGQPGIHPASPPERPGIVITGKAFTSYGKPAANTLLYFLGVPDSAFISNLRDQGTVRTDDTYPVPVVVDRYTL